MGALHSWRTRRRSLALRPLMLRSMSNRASMRLTASSATGEIAGAFFARRALLRLRNAAAQTRIVSETRIRQDPRKSARPFKGIIFPNVSEFESYMPSQAVRSLWDVWSICRLANPHRDADAAGVHARCLPAAGKFTRVGRRERNLSSRRGPRYSPRLLMT